MRKGNLGDRLPAGLWNGEIRQSPCSPTKGYQFVFSMSGRAFQAQVWLNRQLAEPLFRKQALEVLKSFHILAHQ